MNNYIETKVSYNKVLETGTEKKVTETYIVDAMTCTEAEARCIEEVTPFVEGELSVKAVKTEKISEIFADSEGNKWYRCKVMFITLDEKSGIEKKSPSTMLVQAANFGNAVNNLNDGMKGTMADWYIHTITETNIVDVIRVE